MINIKDIRIGNNVLCNGVISTVHGILKYGLILDEDYDFQEEDLFDCDIEGIYGFSHRGGSIFRIGDKIFDAKWRPSDEDLKSMDFQKMIKSFDKTNEGLNNENYSIKDKIVESMPFTKRGSETIKDWSDAKLAAKNLSKYLG